MNTPAHTPVAGPQPARAWLLWRAKDRSQGLFLRPLPEAGAGPSGVWAALA